MAAVTRLRSLETINGSLSELPPCSSPTKRSNTSPSLGVEGSPRILRTKLSNGKEEEVRLELDVEGIENGDLPHDPSTPPEYHETGSLVGLGFDGLATEEKGQVIEQELESNEGATQTETAERQTRELGQLSYQAQNLLARLCSQHPYSEYNNLKRAVAAAVPGTQTSAQHIQTAPPMPPFRHAQSAGPSTFPASPPSSRPSPPLRTASAGPLASSQSTRNVETTRSTRSNANTPPRSTLTPSLARVNFEFSLNAQPTTSATPVVVQQRSAAEHTVDTILNDLVEGEPVMVERTPTKVVVSETVPTPTPAAVPGLLPGMQLINGVPVKTSTSHPINISPLVPPELLPYFAARIFSSFPSSSSSTPIPSGLPSSDDALSSFIIHPQPSCDLLTMITPVSNGICPVLPHSSYRPPNSMIPPFIGNFMLSSCPGKKVRMNGEAVKGGRGAICRDVKLDLQRAKDEGVRMVVCCLDDSELAYLGTPFSEYSAACTELELQVLRIPMVEGFAPTSPASLDAQLDRLIRNHTLKGESVLAHCRGGIGRAGLVASCWMIKMGMVGRRHGFEEMRRGEKEWKDEDPIVIVERVIELIRKRRSVKSIETTHQVRFLLQYIEHLQTQAHFVSASDLTGLESPTTATTE